MIDFVDQDNVPSRVAIRNFEFVTKCNGGDNHNLPCVDDTSCAGTACVNLAGRDIDLDPIAVGLQGVYVYGLERQPFITEVTTVNDPADPNPIIARGVEIFNPYELDIPADNPAANEEYFLYEVDGNLAGAHRIELGGILRGTVSATGPFTTYYSENLPGSATILLNPPMGQPIPLTGLNLLSFKNDWMIYLVRRVEYTTGLNPGVVEIVVDQFWVKGDGPNRIGKDDPAEFTGLPVPPIGPELRFSLERVVQSNSPWTAPIPLRKEGIQGHASLGDWNLTATDGTIHPVDVNFANTDAFGSHAGSTVPASFPTTGSLALLMRQSNRAITDYVAPDSPLGTKGAVTDLAFTTKLVGGPSVNLIFEDPNNPGTLKPTQVNFLTEKEIDNGRMPFFDIGQLPVDPNAGLQSMHHLQPRLFKAWDPLGTNPNSMDKGLPGDLNMLPWGQLVFDYFTALPLSNGGPYSFDPTDPEGVTYLGLPEMPKVDSGGLRVHGRININAAPWKVLAGLPMIPINTIPDAFRLKIDGILASPDPAVAQPIGPELAQAIVAYRDARAVIDSAAVPVTGDYYIGLPATTLPGVYGRGWSHPFPASRRGTGFMSIGELANVRHPGASGAAYRVSADKINADNNDNNTQDFIEAAAVLIALGDWVSVRSQVFTVYGMIRGADDDTIADPAQRLLDTDARAIRFQETIDRLPVLQGQPRPQRIGERTVGRYTDVNND
jgi:hypothetical protein